MLPSSGKFHKEPFFLNILIVLHFIIPGCKFIVIAQNMFNKNSLWFLYHTLQYSGLMPSGAQRIL